MQWLYTPISSLSVLTNLLGQSNRTRRTTRTSVWIAGVGVRPPTVFSTPPQHPVKLCSGGSAMYYIHRIYMYITILVGLWPSKSSTSQLVFHNSNTEDDTSDDASDFLVRGFDILWLTDKKPCVRKSERNEHAHSVRYPRTTETSNIGRLGDVGQHIGRGSRRV